jgi:multidrug efflux system membrane fusion protein
MPEEKPNLENPVPPSPQQTQQTQRALQQTQEALQQTQKALQQTQQALQQTQTPQQPQPTHEAKPKSPETPPKSPPKKGGCLPWIIVLVIILCVGGLVALLFFRKPKPAAPPPPTRVSTTNATTGDIGIYVSALGSVTPLATVGVSSQVTGALTKVNYAEGDMVKAGDLLVQIDERPFQAQLTAAEGQLERDQALLEEARMDLKRYQSAVSQGGAIPRQQYEDQLALTHQDEGTVKYDQGQVDNAKVQLGYCRIVSPISGRVGLRLVDPGNIVQASSTNALVVLTQLQPITIIFAVAEDYLPQIQHQLAIGNRMTVEAYDRTQQTRLASGNVLALDNQIDSNTGTVRLRSLFANEDNALFPNQFVNVSLLIDTLRNKTLIPASAVQRNAQVAFVYVVTNETAQMRTIKVDATDGNVAAVDGLQPGETIVTDNFNRLQDGAKISERKPGDNENRASGAGARKTNSTSEDKSAGARKRKRADTNAPQQ